MFLLLEGASKPSSFQFVHLPSPFFRPAFEIKALKTLQLFAEYTKNEKGVKIFESGSGPASIRVKSLTPVHFWCLEFKYRRIPEAL